MNNEIEYDLSQFNLPHKCDRCGNATPLPGLCPLCRLGDVEANLKALTKTIEEYMPMVIPRGEHELSYTELFEYTQPVPIWVSVVVTRPVLVVPPSDYYAVTKTMGTKKFTLIKDEYQAVGGAARSVGEPNSVEGEAWIDDQRKWWEEHQKTIDRLLSRAKEEQS